MWYRLSTRQNTSSLHGSSQRVSIAGPVKADTNRTGVFRSFTKTLYASSTSPLRKREKDALETLLSFEHIFSSPTRFQRTLYASSTSPPLEELGGLYGKDTSHLRDILRTNLCTRAWRLRFVIETRYNNKKGGFRLRKPSDASISASQAGPKLVSINQWTW